MRKLFGLLLNFICWLLFSFPGLGQDDIPIGLIRGVLLEIKGTEHAGEIKVKSVEEEPSAEP